MRRLNMWWHIIDNSKGTGEDRKEIDRYGWTKDFFVKGKKEYQSIQKKYPSEDGDFETLKKIISSADKTPMPLMWSRTHRKIIQTSDPSFIVPVLKAHPNCIVKAFDKNGETFWSAYVQQPRPKRTYCEKRPELSPEEKELMRLKLEKRIVADKINKLKKVCANS